MRTRAWLKNWHSGGYRARHLTLQGQRWDWLARFQYTETGCDRKFDLQFLSQCGSACNCLSRCVPDIHNRVAGELSNRQGANKQILSLYVYRGESMWSDPWILLCSIYIIHFHSGVVHPLQGVALHQCLLLFLCLMLSCSRWFSPSLICHPATFSFIFFLFGCHSVKRLIYLWSFILAISPAYFHFCFRIYSGVRYLCSFFWSLSIVLYAVVSYSTFSSNLLFE